MPDPTSQETAAASSPAAAAAPASPPSGDGAAPPSPDFVPTPPDAFERKPAAPAAARPEHIPEKFWKDGKPLVDELAKSYSELERWRGQKVESIKADLMKEIEAERTSGVPKSADEYTIPQIETADTESIAKHPLTAWWKETALKNGLSQKQFEEGVSTYLDAMSANEPNLEEEAKQLGENAQVRIEAVSLWAQRNFTGAEYEAIARAAQTAGGIQVLERLMQQGGATPPASFERSEALTPESVRAMMNDPRYFKPGHRDPAYVAKVDAAFKKLYG